MKRGGWLALVAAALAGGLHAQEARAAGVQQAFLVQNSGWMEPFYTDPKSQFKPLVAAVIAAAASPQDPVFVAAFNQSTAANASPVVLSRGTGAGDATRTLAPLAVATKGRSRALADTDFREAIEKTVTDQFKSAPGIIWIFTNNKNSPNNDAQTAERNRDFYRLLHLEPSIARTIVFPLRMPVAGKLYSAAGLMVYALAYGEPASVALKKIVDDGRLATIFTIPAARLKPIDQDAVRIVPVSVRNSGNARASMAADRRTLVFDIDAGSVVPVITLGATLENLFYPYVIASATVDATLVSREGSRPVEVVPRTIERLLPGAAQPVEVKVPVPLAQIPSVWSWASFAAMGKQISVPVLVDVRLSGQLLALSDDFKSSLSTLFPGDPLSEMFVPPASVRESRAKIPMLLRIQYPLMPVATALAATLLLLAGLAAAAFVLARPARYAVVVDGSKRTVALGIFASADVRDDFGQPVGRLARGLGRPRVEKTEPGHSLVLA